MNEMDDVRFSLFGVSLPEFDSATVNFDILPNILNEFFSSGKPQVNSFSRQIGKDFYLYDYELRKDAPFKWKVTINKLPYQTSKCGDDGSYSIHTHNKNGRAIKVDFFNNQHIWQKSVYFDPNNTSSNIYENNDICTVMPKAIDEGTLLLKYINHGDQPNVLYLCDIPSSPNILKKLLLYSPEYDASAFSDVGMLFFAEPEKMSAFNFLLSKIESDNNLSETAVGFISKRDKSNGFDINANDFAEQPTPAAVLSFKSQMLNYVEDTDGELCQDHQISVESEAVTSEISKYESDLDSFLNFDVDQWLRDKMNDTADPIKAPSPSVVNTESKEPSAEKTHSYLINDSVIGDLLKSCGYFDDEIQNILNQTQSENADIKNGNTNRNPYADTGAINNEIKRIHNPSPAAKSDNSHESSVKYIGSYDENDVRQGFGTIYNDKGQFIYTGNWEDDKKSGIGLFRNKPNGAMQFGTWRNDKPIGLTTNISASGNITYIGKLKNGKRDGIGITFDENKNPVISIWKNGLDIQTLYSIEGAKHENS